MEANWFLFLPVDASLFDNKNLMTCAMENKLGRISSSVDNHKKFEFSFIRKLFISKQTSQRNFTLN